MKRSTALILTVILAFTLVYGIAQMFQLQMEKGNQYPAYSTFRSDPMGARLFFDALNEWSHGKTFRVMNRTWDQLTGEKSTFLILDAKTVRQLFTRVEGENIERFLRGGGRLVVAFNEGKNFRYEKLNSSLNTVEKVDSPAEPPTDQTAPTEPTSEVKEETEEQIKKRKQEEEERRIEESLARQFWHMGKIFGFQIQKYVEQEKDDAPTSTDEKSEKEDEETSDEKLSSKRLLATPSGNWDGHKVSDMEWRSENYFLLGDADWKIRYSVNDRPVVIERAWNGGVVVLISEPSLFSNQQLMDSPGANTLLAIVGKDRSYYFDETHLNVVRRYSLVQLIQKYHGMGVVWGTVILLLLWIWKNQSVLAPQPDPVMESVGRSASPLHNLSGLIEAHLNEKMVWEEMIHEWQRSRRDDVEAVHADAARAWLKAEFEKKERSTSEAIYFQINNILNERIEHGTKT